MRRSICLIIESSQIYGSTLIYKFKNIVADGLQCYQQPLFLRIIHLYTWCISYMSDLFFIFYNQDVAMVTFKASIQLIIGQDVFTNKPVCVPVQCSVGS